MDQHGEIVRVADDPVIRQAFTAPGSAPAFGRHCPARLPRPVKLLVERAQGNVEDQRGQDAALRRSGEGVLVLTEFGQHPGLEERLHQRQDAFVLHPCPHPVHDGRVRDVVERRFDVRVQHPPVSSGAVVVDLRDRVLRAPPWPEPVRDRLEVSLENRLQHQFQRGLDHLVGNGGDGDFILPLLQSRVLGLDRWSGSRRWP